MKFAKDALIVGLFSSFALSALAGPTSQPDNDACTAASWKITGAVTSAAYNGSNLQSVGPISATSCAGMFTGNNDPQQNPAPNLGYRNDGLLNGGGNLLSPTQFIDPSQLQDLKTPGSKVDPGWVMLGVLRADAGTLSTSSVKPDANKPAFDLGNVLKYTQTEAADGGHGTWLLQIDTTIVAELNAAGLFQRSFFDHLAFSVKAGNEWAVYDFDFNKINASTGGAFDLQTPYTIAGTWTNELDFANSNGKGKDISHLAVWARDPVTDAEIDVPEPSDLALAGIGLAALAWVRRKRSIKA